MRKILLGLVFGLAASCAHAQAPSPADVGVSKGTPDVFKLKGHDNAWTPFGSIDPSTHVYVPGTNGNIAPNDCIKWGPGLTSAGAACNSVTGGAHPANQLTIYTNHAGLVANVTTPTEAWTVTQQGFYSPGDGGDAVYQWSLTSYCAGGTSGAPVTADGLACVLPIGQSASTAGRYLLSMNGSLDVRKIGMQPGGFDNYPIVQTLMNVISPSNFNEGTMRVIIPGVLGQRYTYYYFSKPFVLSRNMNLDCESSSSVGDISVTLVFPPGVDGVIQEGGYFSPDGHWGQSTIRGCRIMSLGGSPNAFGTTGSGALTGVQLHQGAAGMSMPSSCNPYNGACTVGVGDGVILMGRWIPVGLAVAPGAYVAASNPVAQTLTLAAPYVIGPLTDNNSSLQIWDLPASQKYTIQTTIGSNTMIVTAGPKPLAEGDMLWSDAFLFGSVVGTIDNLHTFPQTITVLDVTMFYPENAVKTHASGSPGQMWTVPVGIKRRVGSSTYQTVVNYFGIGLDLICQITGGAGSAGCDNTFDEHNWYLYGLIGRLTRGDNTTNGTAIGNVGAHNTIADTVEAGSLGSTYISEEYNSQDGGSSSYGVLLNCETQNFSIFIGTYLSGQYHGPCMGRDAQGHLSINVAADDTVNPSQLFIGSTYGYGHISAQSFYGNWKFIGEPNATRTTTTTSASGQNVVAVPTLSSFYRTMTITDLTNPVIPAGTTVADFTTAGVVISNNLTGAVQVGDQIRFGGVAGGPCFSVVPGQVSGGGMWFDVSCSHGGLGITYDGINNAWNVGSIIMPNYGYSGAPIEMANVPIFPQGLTMGNGAEDYKGQERLLDFGSAAPTAPAFQQGDTRLNQQPVPGASVAFTNTQVGARTTLSAPVVSGTTTSVGVAACPNPALAAGTPVDRVALGPDNHNIALNTLLGTLSACTSGTLTFQAAASHSAASGDTIQFLQWRPAGIIANDAQGVVYRIGSNSGGVGGLLANYPCNAGNIGSSIVTDGETVASKGYGAAMTTGGGSTVRPVFCDGTSWTYH